MKKFIEALNSMEQKRMSEETSTQANDTFNRYFKFFKKNIGKRVLYTNKPTRENRVAIIKDVYASYVVIKYYYDGIGLDSYSTAGTTSVSFGSLLCGDATLELEQ